MSSRLGKRGVRVVTNVGRDAVDAGDADTTSGMAADGEVVWSWRSDAGAKFAEMLTRLAGDGGNQAWSPERARRKPLKPSRREGRMIRLYLWFCRVLFCCTRTMGAVGTRSSLRPLFSEGHI
jgi:hypothetical protein